MTKRKILKRIVAFICVGIVGFGMAFVGVRIIEKKKGMPLEKKETIGNNMLANPVEENGIKLMVARTMNASGVATAAEDSVTVTASLTSLYETYNDDLTWSLAFKNPSSDWVDGEPVNDYVTMAVSSDGLSVTLTNEGAFGEPIILTATSVDNPRVKASCQLDYVRRVESIQDFDMWDMNGDGCSGEHFLFNTETEMRGRIVMGVGTVSPTVSLSFEAVEKYGTVFNWLTENYDLALYHLELYFSDETFQITSAGNDFNFEGYATLEFDSIGLPPQGSREDANQIISDAIYWLDGDTFDINAEATITYNGVSYGRKVVNLGSHRSCTENLVAPVSVNGVTLNKSNIAF